MLPKLTDYRSPGMNDAAVARCVDEYNGLWKKAANGQPIRNRLCRDALSGAANSKQPQALSHATPPAPARST